MNNFASLTIDRAGRSIRSAIATLGMKAGLPSNGRPLRMACMLAANLFVLAAGAQTTAEPFERQQVEFDVYQQIIAKDSAYAALFVVKQVEKDGMNTVYCISPKGADVYTSQLEENKRLALQQEADATAAAKPVSIDSLMAAEPAMEPEASTPTTLTNAAAEPATATTPASTTPTSPKKKRKHKESK